jgi:hypothetical protein
MFFKLLALIPRIIAWLQIMLSPFLFAVLLAVLTYAYFPGMPGLVMSCAFVLIGLVGGIIRACRISRKYGTVEYMTPTSSSRKLQEKKLHKK